MLHPIKFNRIQRNVFVVLLTDCVIKDTCYKLHSSVVCFTINNEIYRNRFPICKANYLQLTQIEIWASVRFHFLFYFALLLTLYSLTIWHLQLFGGWCSNWVFLRDFILLRFFILSYFTIQIVPLLSTSYFPKIL